MDAVPGWRASHHGALGGGEVDGVDAGGQGLLQVQQDVGADAGAGGGALGGGGLVQQLLEAVQFNEQHHVLQEVALDESRQLRGTEELGVLVEVHTGFRGDVLGADDLTVSLKGLELEEFGCREELHHFSVAYVQRLSASTVQILHDQLKYRGQGSVTH